MGFQQGGEAIDGLAQGAGQAQFSQIVGEDAGDQVQLRAGDGLLRLHDLDGIDDAGFHARAGHLQGLLGDLQILARDLDLAGGGFQMLDLKSIVNMDWRDEVWGDGRGG